jgi:hypothetical protein
LHTHTEEQSFRTLILSFLLHSLLLRLPFFLLIITQTVIINLSFHFLFLFRTSSVGKSTLYSLDESSAHKSKFTKNIFSYCFISLFCITCNHQSSSASLLKSSSSISPSMAAWKSASRFNGLKFSLSSEPLSASSFLSLRSKCFSQSPSSDSPRKRSSFFTSSISQSFSSMEYVTKPASIMEFRTRITKFIHSSSFQVFL